MDMMKLITNIIDMDMINLIITDIDRIKLISIIDKDMIKLIINIIDKDYDQTDKISMADTDMVKLITKSTELMGTWVVMKYIISIVIIATWVVNASGEIVRSALIPNNKGQANSLKRVV